MAGARIATMPRGYWHADELRLAEALLTSDGMGAPLYVALARALNVFIRNPFLSLVVLSIAASVAAAIFCVRLGSALFGDARCGAALALLVSLSPAMLVFGPLPRSHSLALACVVAALFCLVERKRVLCLLAFAAAIAAWPPIGAAAEVSLRPEAMIRLIAHPWGDKVRSVPLLLAATAGVVISLRRFRQPVFVAIALYGGLHLLLSSHGVTAMFVTAFFAVAAVARWPAVAMILVGIFSAASISYAWPAVVERTEGHGPAIAAMQYAERTHSFVVAAGDLAPFRTAGEREGDVLLLVHGRSEAPGAVTFATPVSDACGKLHGDRFHAVSLVPERHRIASSRGVYAMESSPEAGEWRWLAKEAVIELDGSEVTTLRFRLPENAPVETNRVSAGGRTVEISRGSTKTLHLPRASRVVIHADRSFAPGDGRELSVQLLHIR